MQHVCSMHIQSVHYYIVLSRRPLNACVHVTKSQRAAVTHAWRRMGGRQEMSCMAAAAGMPKVHGGQPRLRHSVRVPRLERQTENRFIDLGSGKPCRWFEGEGRDRAQLWEGRKAEGMKIERRGEKKTPATTSICCLIENAMATCEEEGTGCESRRR